jgi:hypothetical protein
LREKLGGVWGQDDKLNIFLHKMGMSDFCHYFSNSKFYKFPKYNNIWSNSKILQSEKFPENHILSGQLSKFLL